MAKKKSEQFEDALSNLEKIVEKLERGDLPLEDSLAAFTEGVRLVQLCHKKLEEAEKKVQTLLKDQDSEWSTAPFEPSAANSAKE